MDGGGEEGNVIRMELCAERRLKLQFQGGGIWDGEMGLLVAFFFRLAADCRFPGRQVLSEVQ